MPELQRLRADHAPAVLAFELANRVYFAASISDRGDEFFDRFTERHSALLAEQEAGIGAFYVLVAEDGSVLGRFNLYDIKDGTAKLGYRVAQHVAGCGVATATVRELCGLAAAQYGLRTLKAATFRGAGHRVLSPAVAADALPIIQEGLTNSMKHAPGAPVSVTLEATATGLNIDIINEPARSAPLELDGGAGGAGLPGMTERVKAHGGQLSAGPVPGGGWRVAASLPSGTHPGLLRAEDDRSTRGGT